MPAQPTKRRSSTVTNPSVEAVYTFIVKFLQDNDDLSPTVREIAEGCYMSPSSVMYYLARLEAKGKISRQENRARSIRLVDEY